MMEQLITEELAKKILKESALEIRAATSKKEYMSSLTDKLNEYCLPRPTYEDGEPIQFGDKVRIDGSDESFTETVTSLTISGQGTPPRVNYWLGMNNKVTKVEPDTWEKLEQLASMYVCEYWGQIGETCSSCPITDCQIDEFVEDYANFFCSYDNPDSWEVEQKARALWQKHKVDCIVGRTAAAMAGEEWQQVW